MTVNAGIERAWRRVNGNWAVVVLLLPFVVYILGLYFLALPKGPWVTWDSRDYLGLAPYRTLGYPLYLRLVALFADDMNAAVAGQLVFGLGAVLFFAEVLQRTVRNCLVSVPVGVFLIFNWPVLEHAFILLTDYPFFGLLCLHFGALIACLSEPTRPRLLLAAITMAMAVFLRPAALFLLIGVPFVLVAHRRSWRSVAVYLVAPVVLFGLAQASAHKAVFDYFGLSKIAGQSLAPNTMFVLGPDTPSGHPQLARRLYAAAKPFQDKYAAVPDPHAKTIYNINVSNRLARLASEITRAYGEEQGLITRTDARRRHRFLDLVNGLSPLNRKLARMPRLDFSQSVWLDSSLLGLAIDAHRHNPRGWANLAGPNLLFGWNYVIPNTLMPEKDFSFRATLRLDRPDFGLGAPTPGALVAERPVFTPRAFNRVAGLLNDLGRTVPISWVVLASGLAAIVLFVVQAVRERAVTTPVAALAYLSVSVFVYHLEVLLVSLPLPRLIAPVIAAPLTLLFAPILLVFHAARSMVPRRHEGHENLRHR